jgi:hypothetical protein
MRGGNGNYTDGSSYGMYVNGTGGSQWNRTMDQEGAYGQVPGNVIIGAQGQNVTSPSQVPSQSNLQLVQNGGTGPLSMDRDTSNSSIMGKGQGSMGPSQGNMGPSQGNMGPSQGNMGSSQGPDMMQKIMQQRAGRRRRRGGFLGEVINQAAVPLSILAMQQTYRRKRGGKRRKTRRYRRR